MPALIIPSEHRGPLLELSALPDDGIAEITALLERATPKLRRYSFASAVAKGATTLPPTQVEAIVDALIEMALVRETAEVPMEMFVDDVIESLSVGEPVLQPEGHRILKARLPKLLAIPSIALPAKGRSLLIEHANYMCSARIFTDIRPVFGADTHQSPATALVVHTLKMEYHHGEAKTRNFFVALDSNDLDELSDLIERAREKEGSLKAVLASAGLEPLD